MAQRISEHFSKPVDQNLFVIRGNKMPPRDPDDDQDDEDEDENEDEEDRTDEPPVVREPDED